MAAEDVKVKLTGSDGTMTLLVNTDGTMAFTEITGTGVKMAIDVGPFLTHVIAIKDFLNGNGLIKIEIEEEATP